MWRNERGDMKWSRLVNLTTHGDLNNKFSASSFCFYFFLTSDLANPFQISHRRLVVCPQDIFDNEKPRTGRLAANYDTLTTGSAGGTAVLRIPIGVGATGVIRVESAIAAASTTTVKLDAVTLAGDTVALAAAVGRSIAEGGDGRRGRVAGSGRESRWAGRHVGVGVKVREVSLSEAGSDLIDGRGQGEVGLTELAGSIGLGGLWVLDARGRERAALWDVDGGVAAMLGSSALLGTAGDIDDVELAACGWLDGKFNGGVVGDVVTINDIIVPISLPKVEGSSLEAESSLPGTRFGSVIGERELAAVVVPRTEQVDGLDVGGSAEREVKLNCSHYCRSG
jgi:hypothetical protein